LLDSGLLDSGLLDSGLLDSALLAGCQRLHQTKLRGKQKLL